MDVFNAQQMTNRRARFVLALALLAYVVGLPVTAWAQPTEESPSTPALQTPPQTQQLTPTSPEIDPTDPVEDFQFGAFLTADPGTALAGVPAMFGDSLFRGGNLTLINMPTADLTVTLASPLPLAAATRRTLVAEHNKALPVDRVYFNYNHFHNALRTSATVVDTVTPATVAVSRDFSVDQFTLGWEKTFGCGCWSTEFRLPVAGRYDFDFTSPVGGETASVAGGELGNLTVIFKRVLHLDCDTVVSAGFGFDLPTGDNARSQTVSPVRTSFTLNNDTVYFLPYLAAMGQPDCQRFWHSFVQLDVPLNAHEYRFATATPPTVVTGEWEDQTLLHIDIGGGYWLHRDVCCCPSMITGIAAIAELHYTTALDNTDVDTATVAGAGTQMFDLRNAANRIDVINATAGVHFELAHCSTLRVATALPLRGGDNCWFDAEILVQFARQF